MVVLLIEKSFFAVLWYRRPTVSKSPGARFSKSPETFRAHNSLCIFKTKVSRGTKRCSYFDFSQFPLQHVKRPGLHNKRVGVSGPKSFRDFGENGPLDKRHLFSLPCPTPYISLPLPILFSWYCTVEMRTRTFLTWFSSQQSPFRSSSQAACWSSRWRVGLQSKFLASCGTAGDETCCVIIGETWESFRGELGTFLVRQSPWSVFCFVFFLFANQYIRTISNDHCDMSFCLRGSEAYVQTAFQLGNAGVHNVPILWYDLPNNLSMENKCRYFCLAGMWFVLKEQKRGHQIQSQVQKFEYV